MPLGLDSNRLVLVRYDCEATCFSREFWNSKHIPRFFVSRCCCFYISFCEYNIYSRSFDGTFGFFRQEGYYNEVASLLLSGAEGATKLLHCSRWSLLPCPCCPCPCCWSWCWCCWFCMVLVVVLDGRNPAQVDHLIWQISHYLPGCRYATWFARLLPS